MKKKTMLCLKKNRILSSAIKLNTLKKNSNKSKVR